MEPKAGECELSTASAMKTQHDTARHAIQAFLTSHPLTEAAATDLLELIHQLVSPEVLSLTRQLPRTSRSLWRLEHKTQRNQAAIQIGDSTDLMNLIVDDLVVDNGQVVEQFLHFPFLCQIGDLLLEDVNVAAFADKFTERTNSNGLRVYGELASANWWKDAEAYVRVSLGEHLHLLSVIPYADGVSVDFFGNVHMIPVMITLGNFAHAVTETLSGKRLLGFIPHLSEAEIAKRTRTSASSIRRQLMHAAFSM